jgi:capsular polysaccharide biosynthesis protein
MMNDNDQAFLQSMNKHNGQTGRLWAADDFTAEEDDAVDFNAGLASLGFIRAAVRRSARFWGAVAVAGMLLGSAVYVTTPHAVQASTTLLLTVGPEAVAGTAIQDDVAIAQSRAVAGLVVDKLKLPQSPSSFLSMYTATPVTDRVMLITASAPSGNEAVTWANAVAAEFLRYRAKQLNASQQQEFTALNQQLDQAKQQISGLNSQISTVLAQPGTPAQRDTLTRLRTRLSQDQSALITLQQTVNQTRAGTQETTASEIKGSGVIDTAAPIPPRSKVKYLILYAAVGFVAGLALSLGIIVIRALISDRLYRRDDVARALGAPVKLSVGAIPRSRLRGSRQGLAGAENTNVRRIVAHLIRAIPARSRHRTALAVVPVDDPQVAAWSLISLAVSCAQRGMQVMVADLASGAPAVRLLGSAEPGVHTMNIQDVRLIVAIPEPDDVAPLGPLGGIARQATRSPFTEAVTAACASSDVLLTLAPLDPSLGGDHFTSWATEAVAVVTAGRSSWTRIHAVGEMIRLAGVRLVSAVLVRADKTDDSLGAVSTSEVRHAEQAVNERPRPGQEDSFSTVAPGSRRRRSDDR